MRPTDKATADSRSLQSFAIIKNTGHGIIRLRLACVQSRPPHRPSFSDFFLRGGAAVHRLSGANNPVFKVRRIAHLKLKLFHFQIKTYYLSDANHQMDNPSHKNNPFLV